VPEALGDACADIVAKLIDAGRPDHSCHPCDRYWSYDTEACEIEAAHATAENSGCAGDRKGRSTRGDHLQAEAPAHDARRSPLRARYDAFTPEELATVFEGCGYRVEERESEDDAEPPMLRCRKRGVSTIVEIREQVPGENLFRGATLSYEMEARPEELAQLPQLPEADGDAAPMATISIVLLFSGPAARGSRKRRNESLRERA
jgi:hypothetical protein